MFRTPVVKAAFDDRVAEKLARAGIPVTPTLQVFRDLTDDLPDDPERSRWQYRQETQRRCVARLRDLGVPILAGFDAGWRATAFDTFWKELDDFTHASFRRQKSSMPLREQPRMRLAGR